MCHGHGTSMTRCSSEEFDPKEYDKNVADSGDGKEYVEYDFDNPENDSLSDMVKTGEEEIHLDGSETVDDPFVQTPDKQYSKGEMQLSIYVNAVNVVNQNEPPSSEKVVRQLVRKRFVGKALVDSYTVQPPTNVPSAFLKVDMKRLKRKARMLQIQNRRNSFDDDVGDDDPDLKLLSLEEWESTKLKNKRNKKEPITQSQIALKEIPLVEFHKEIGWLSDIHLDAWFELVWSFRPTDADWAIASSYFCGFVMRGDIPGWVCNGVRCKSLENAFNMRSINSLTRIVRRVHITMLVEYCRDLLQRWYCEKRHKYEEAPENELCDWAAAKVYDKMLKSANWTVRPIDHLKLFQVFNKLEVHQVDLVGVSMQVVAIGNFPDYRTVMLCAVCEFKFDYYNLWASRGLRTTTLKRTFQELVYSVKDPKMLACLQIELQFVNYRLL
ncbi:hypothetical protein Tco_0102771 [Tanacetum coccineum]